MGAKTYRDILVSTEADMRAKFARHEHSPHSSKNSTLEFCHHRSDPQADTAEWYWRRGCRWLTPDAHWTHAQSIVQRRFPVKMEDGQ